MRGNPATNEPNRARDEILASIRRNLTASAPFDAVHAEHDHHGEIRVQKNSVDLMRSTKGLVDIFRENLESVGGKCAVVDNNEDASKLLQAIIDHLNPTRIAFSDSPIVNAVRAIRREAKIIQNAPAETLFDCEIGVTSAQWGIAETGTLVLESEREFNRLTSLVPPVHVCILEAGNIRASLGEILQTVQRDLSPAVTFITGPSRTSDIELTLAIGVHGPRELHVIVIP